MTALKCVDCIHHAMDGYKHVCMHGAAADVVTGAGGRDCYYVRDDFHKCGPEARWWEPKLPELAAQQDGSNGLPK